MPRSGTPADMQWIEADPCYVFHFANGYEKDGRIILDACHFDTPPLFPMADGAPTPPNIHPRMSPWVIDLDGNKPVGIRMNYPAVIPGSDWVYNAIVHFDVQTGKVDRYAFSQGYVAEPMFVPRSAGAAEGEGWVLCCVYDIPSNTSALHVFEAQKLAAGPIGKAKVSHRVPVSFHGTWRPAP